MSDTESLINIFRGESVNLNPFRKRASSLLNEEGKKLVGKYATTSSEEAANYASRKFPNKVMSTKITSEEFKIGKELFAKNSSYVGNYAKERGYNILSNKNASNLKIDLVKTFQSNIKSLTPLALKGLKYFISLPAQTAIMSLDSTPVNIDEINMTLEDFGKLKEQEIDLPKFNKSLLSRSVE